MGRVEGNESKPCGTIRRGGRNSQRHGEGAIAAAAVAALLLVTAPAAAAQGAADAAARRATEARVLAEYPADADYFPVSNYRAYPAALREPIRRADMEADTCRGSGDNQEVLRACIRADAALAEVERKGWCWGGARREAERHWLPCSDQPGYRPMEAPPGPVFADADIAALPWQVAENEASCRGPEAARCSEAELAKARARLDADLRKLAGLMAPPARLRLEQEQAAWLGGVEASAAGCAEAMVPPGPQRDVALLRCRTGLMIARQRQIQRLLPLADEMPGSGAAGPREAAGAPARGMHGWGSINPRLDRRRDFVRLTGVDLADASEDQQMQFRDWELHHTEAAARETIDEVRSAGGKAAAIALLYVRSVDKWRRAEEGAAIAEEIRRRAEAVEKK